MSLGWPVIAWIIVVIISRDNGVTVVRLGKTQDNLRRPVHEALAKIITLFPKGSTT